MGFPLTATHCCGGAGRVVHNKLLKCYVLMHHKSFIPRAGKNGMRGFEYSPSSSSESHPFSLVRASLRAACEWGKSESTV